jgi:alkanesulfonate monooxygenase SsuD/methylene tetrahydromethanopterin reductase-like flavin-dependent oxidoreductase (luciferase family)
VAKEGFNTLFGFTRTGMDVIAAGVAQYREVWAQHVEDEGRINGHVAQPKLGATRHVFVAGSDAEAQDIAREAYNLFDRSFVMRPGRDGSGESRRGDFETAVGWGGIFAGSPETVRQQVQAFLDESGANYFVGTFAFGNLTTEQVLNSLRLFSREVMPAVSQREAVG